MRSEINELRQALQAELTEHILPYWLRLEDTQNGGWYGQVLADETVVPTADRGAILYGRILWTFSAAYRLLKRPEYLAAATRTKDYILNHFIDPQFGGVFWQVDYKGQPVDTRKQFYALGFILYGLSEYVRITNDQHVLEQAVNLYQCIEQHAWDNTFGGYIEATLRDWSAISDYRLSNKDLNAPKSQNTHLHIIEPYTNLYRVWPDEQLRASILRLMDVFIQHILRKDNHLGLFYEMDWKPMGNAMSCGHDIEFSWLLDEAAEVVGVNQDEVVKRVAQAAKEGLQTNGAMHGTWWEQAETVIGYFNLYQRFGDEKGLAIAYTCWKAIEIYFIDHIHGEWYEHANNQPQADKAGFWKCPYHNSRMCLEIMERVEQVERV